MKRYTLIYADPPWRYRDLARAGNRGLETKYPTMSLDEICALDVDSIAADDALLALWVTSPTMFDYAPAVFGAWGFAYKTIGLCWVKTSKGMRATNAQYLGAVRSSLAWGMGHWTRANVELCLIGTRGRPQRVSRSVHQVMLEPVGRHSEKPAAARDALVQLLGDVPRIELFARRRARGWDAWGPHEGLHDVEL